MQTVTVCATHLRYFLFLCAIAKFDTIRWKTELRHVKSTNFKNITKSLKYNLEIFCRTSMRFSIFFIYHRNCKVNWNNNIQLLLFQIIKLNPRQSNSTAPYTAINQLITTVDLWLDIFLGAINMCSIKNICKYKENRQPVDLAGFFLYQLT